MLRFVPSALILALAACASPPEPAPVPGDPAIGEQIAFDLCSSCHAIGADDVSPNTAAPPLRTVLAAYDAERLAHDLEDARHIAWLRMPQFFFGENHARDVVAYIQTIQRPSR